MRVSVLWDFTQTELENTDYDNAVEQAGLSHIVLVPVDIAYEDEDEITDWIREEYGFEMHGWHEID